MEKKYKISLFIFRRDLRIEDNTALIEALKQSERVLPAFIFDPAQISKTNSFRSPNAIRFMIESLDDLQVQLETSKGKLLFLHGKPEEAIKSLLKSVELDAIFVNRDYTPYSTDRDDKIKSFCESKNIKFISYNDLLLNEPEEIKTGSGEAYQKFTAFFKKAIKKQIAKPEKNNLTNYYDKKVPENIDKDFLKSVISEASEKTKIKGGRKNCLKILDDIESFDNYAKTRDFPAIETTQLSAHIKFGTSSIREVYYAIYNKLSPSHELIQQLYWRDFFTHIAFNYPYVFGYPFKKKYEALKWSDDQEKFKLWCQGKTGFPIVDAGMRQLNQTGFMHNRVRMIVASFLTKDLHINWLWGEKYFAQQLVDYDPSVNNGNWQWVASTGCDSQPYFRIFNPWLQQKKFDPECTYIKYWIPELSSYSPKEIHNWHTNKQVENLYPEPICDHKKEAPVAKKAYKSVS